MIKVDETTFEEIKAAKEDGLTSKECADEMKLDLQIVNKVYGASTSYKLYKNEPETELVEPTKAAYYRSLLAKKAEDNQNLTESRGYLLEQVTFLRKAVAFLEIRKRELEDGIKNLEIQVRVGVSMMESLEEVKK